MGTVNAGSLATVATPLSASSACKQPKSLAVPLDFSATLSWVLDIGPLQDQSLFDNVVCLYVDNSANGASVTVSISGTLQVISCPANSQGYFPVLANARPVLTFATGGGVTVNFQVLNFEVQPAVWHA
jgi:hypothetical protein